MKTDLFGVEIVIYSDDKHETNYARIKFTFEAESIESAIVMAVNMLKSDHICKHYKVVKVRNHSVV